MHAPRERTKRAPTNSSPRGRGAVPADRDVLWCLAGAIETARPPQQCADDYASSFISFTYGTVRRELVCRSTRAELVSLSPVLSACAQDALTGRRGGKRLAAGVE